VPDHRAIAIVMAVVSLIFVALWSFGGPDVTVQPRSTPKAVGAGVSSGITSMVAHSGDRCLRCICSYLGPNKEIYAGTSSMFFTVGNALKAAMAVAGEANVWIVMAACLLAIPAGGSPLPCRWQ